MKTINLRLLLILPLTFMLLVLVTGSARAAITLYCCDAAEEARYLADLALLGFTVSTVQESFEDTPPWPRFLSSASSVSNLGITWSPLDSHPASAGMTTSTANPHNGSYEMFSFDSNTFSHPIPDGYSLTTGGSFPLYGVGGWFRSAQGAKLGFTVDGDATRVDFTGEEATVFGWKFLGFIEDDVTSGFSKVEIHSVEDKEEQRKTFFSDNFKLAGVLPVSTCGNSTIDAGEDCDDGNTLSGDCCSATCKFEPVGSQCPDGLFCNGVETCDGVGSCQPGVPMVCDDGVDLNGTVQTIGGLDICAMVLASGQYMFSCNPNGIFSLTNLPRDSDGSIKLQLYADGFHPYIVNLSQSAQQAITMISAGNCPDYNQISDPGVYPGSAGQWIEISGKVLVGEDQQTPICAMVLANGKYMFSCEGSGSYALAVPLDTSGNVKLQVYADGFAPTIMYFDEFAADNVVKMARASECQ